MDIELKKTLHTHCQSLVEDRIAEAKKVIAQTQAAANEETKSSAGDKYETSREMMQQEQNKAALQLMETLKLKKVLDELNPAKLCEKVEQGCLVQTDKACFYIAIPLGQLVVEGRSFVLISALAPLALLLMGKRAGEEVLLNGRSYLIEEIV